MRRAGAVSRMPLVFLFPFIGPSRPGQLSARLIARAAVIQLTAPRMWRTRTLPSAASSSNLFIVAARSRASPPGSSRFLDDSSSVSSSLKNRNNWILETNLSFSIASRSRSEESSQLGLIKSGDKTQDGVHRKGGYRS